MIPGVSKDVMKVLNLGWVFFPGLGDIKDNGEF